MAANTPVQPVQPASGRRATGGRPAGGRRAAGTQAAHAVVWGRRSRLSGTAFRSHGWSAMKKPAKSEGAEGAPGSGDQIAAYSQAQPLAFRTICDRLRELIDTALPKATSKAWHGSPA
jgi:hypothetical protein